MRLYIDLDTQALVSGLGTRSPITALSFKRGDSSRIEVQFFRGVTPAQLPEGTEGKFAIKVTGKYDADPLVLADDWTLEGTGASALYVFTPDFNTVPLNALLNSGDDDEDNDVKSVVCMAEIKWIIGDSIYSSQTLVANIANDVIKGIEGTPSTLPTPDEFVAERAVLFDREQELTRIQRIRSQSNIGMAQSQVVEIADASDEPHVLLNPTRVILASSTCALDSDIDVGGGTDDTAELQALLDLGGDEDSHLEIVLDGVALFSSTLKMSSFTRLRILEDCGLFLAANSHCHLITGPNDGLVTIARDVEILGPGKINGNDANQSKWLEADNQELPSGPWDRVVGWVYGIWFSGFDGLQIKGLKLRNVKTFNIVMAHGQRFRIENCRSEYDLIDHDLFKNRDGVHMFSPLRNGLVRNHYSEGDDDVIAFNTDEDAALTGHPEDLVRGDAGDGGIVDVFIDGVETHEGVNGLRLFGDSGTGWLDRIKVKDFTGTLVFGGMQCAPPTILTRTYTGLFSAGDTGLAFLGRIEIDNYNVVPVAGYEGDVYTDIIIDSAEDLVLRNVPSGVIVRATTANPKNNPSGSGLNGIAGVTLPGTEYPIWEGGGAVTAAGTGAGAPASGWWRMTTGATAGSSSLWRPTSNVFTRFGRGTSDAGVNWDFPVTLAWKGGFQLSTGATLRFQLGRTTADATIANLAGRGVGVILTGGNISLEIHDGTTRLVSGTLATYIVGSFTFNAIRVRSWRGKVELWINDVLVGSMLGGPTVASADSAAGLHLSIENGADASASFVDALPGFMKVYVEP